MFLNGIIIGFSIAVPIGPIGVLCIRRSLFKGFLPGLITGLGAATADAFYGCVAGFGLTFISSFLISYKFGLQSVGIVWLFYLGVKFFMEKPKKQEKSFCSNKRLITDYFSSLALTITNPSTIFSFMAIFVSFGIGIGKTDYISASSFVLGIFVGSTLWWLILSGGSSFFKNHLNRRSLNWINKLAGAVIISLAIIILTDIV